MSRLESLTTILNIHGFKRALWCLRSVKGFSREKILFASFCAKQVKRFMKEQPLPSIVDKYANISDADKDFWDAVLVDSANYASFTMYADLAPDRAGKIAAIAAYDMHAYCNASLADARAARAAQFKEFKRMLNCIENGEAYII